MGYYSFTLLGGNNDLSNPNNWSANVTPGPNDTVVIDSGKLAAEGLLPPGAALSLYGSLDVAGVEFFNSIELTNVSIYVSSEFSVAGFTHFENGTITVNTGSNPGNLDVGGMDGPGQFVQDNGSVTVNTGLLVGYVTNGSYGLNGGTVSASYEVIAGTGSGVFRQNGGSNSVAGQLWLGQGGGPSVGNSGAYFLAAGSLTAGLETIGDASAGELSQSGGSNSVAATLTLGNQQGSSGTYDLTGGTLSVGGNEVIGFSGNGHFDQGGGDNAVQGGVVFSVNQGSSGNYLLHNGATLEAHFLTVGIDGSGEVNIQNASANISGPINLGVHADGHGSLEVIGGGLSASGLGNAGVINVGVSGSGTLVVQNGGSISTNFVRVGVNAAGHGTVDIEGGQSNLSVADNMVLGNGGSALVRIEAGAHVSANRILMATQSGDPATQTGSLAAVQISGAGTIVQANYDQFSDPDQFFNAAVVVGAVGAAELAVTDQARLEGGPMVLGGNTGAEGALMVGSGADIETTALIVGEDGAGEITITGNGTIVHSTGTLFPSHTGVVVGLDGAGAFTIEDGAQLHSETGIELGANVGSHGSMTVDGGVVVTNVLTVGGLGSGTLTLTAGEIDTTDEIVGGQASTVTQSGGTQHIAGSLYLSSVGGGYVLENGAALELHNDIFVYDGSLSGNGSVTIDDGALVLAGGDVEALGGVLKINSSIEQNIGSLLIDSNSTLEFSGQRIGFHVDIHGTQGSENTVFQLDQSSSVVADGGSDSIYAASIINNGWIEASVADHLTMQGVITGTGSMVIDPHATLELNDAGLGGTGNILLETNDDLSIPTVLQIDNDVFLPGNVINGLDIGNGRNTIDGFTFGDVIDLRFLLDGTATLLSGPHQNVLEVNSLGGPYYLQLDPLANYSDVKFVTSDDGAGGTDISMVVDQPPVAAADFAGVEKRSSISVDAQHGVLANDSDSDGDSLSVSAVNGSATNVGHAIVGEYGTLALNDDGSYSYSANSEHGALPADIVPQDIFSYTASDGHGHTSTSTSTLTITLFDQGQHYLATTAGQETLDGGNGRDVLVGGTSNSTLIGGNGEDRLIAGTGNTVMTGGNGPDTFVFAPGLGKDTITDFNPNNDIIQLDHGLVADFASLQSHVQQVGQDTVITLDAASSITLEHVLLSSLHASDFHIV